MMEISWFGSPWGQRVNIEGEHFPTPVGKVCFYCREDIEKWASGVIETDTHHWLNNDMVMVVVRILHVECHIRLVIGSLGHVTKRCACYGGTEDDPPDLTLREAARAAAYAWRLQ